MSCSHTDPAPQRPQGSVSRLQVSYVASNGDAHLFLASRLTVADSEEVNLNFSVIGGYCFLLDDSQTSHWVKR